MYLLYVTVLSIMLLKHIQRKLTHYHRGIQLNLHPQYQPNINPKHKCFKQYLW